MSIEVSLDRPVVRPGEWVSGAVRLPEGGNARGVQVAIGYWERTKDYAHAAVSISSGALRDGDLPGGVVVPFALAVPGGALPGYQGRFGRLEWGVSVKVDRFGPDETAYVPFDVRTDAPAAPDLPALVAERARGGEPPPPGLGAPPAWYADPRGVARLRWYDGAAWSDRTAA